MEEGALRHILRELDIKVANKSGNWLEFSCPFAEWTHGSGKDNRPSAGAVIDLKKPSNYKCHSCKKHGRISSLVRSLEYYREEHYPGLALEADMADATLSLGTFEQTEEEPEVLPPPLNEAAYGDLYGSAYDDPAARAYLKKRGVSRSTAKFLELGFDPNEERVIFPVRHTDGRLYGFTGRSILKPEQYPTHYNYPKVRDYQDLPKKMLLLGADLVKDDGLPIFVVEGLFGYAHLMQIKADNYCHPVALLGSELTEYKAEILKEWNRPVILLPDNDEAGDACLFGHFDKKAGRHDGDGAISKLEAHIPLMIPEWPEGKDDPDQLTIEEVIDMVENTPLHNYSLTKKLKKAK